MRALFHLAKKTLVFQAVFILLTALGGFFFLGPVFASGLGFGGLTALISSWISWMLLSKASFISEKRIFLRMGVAEAAKLGIGAGILTLGFLFSGLPALALVLGYCSGALAQGISPLILRSPRSNP